jgi:hypothetical protein
MTVLQITHPELPRVKPVAISSGFMSRKYQYNGVDFMPARVKQATRKRAKTSRKCQDGIS